jgi:two-component system, LytTR family, sensor kinase
VTGKQFIFSNERKYVLTRHLSFWAAFSIVCFVTGAYPYKPKDLLSTEFYTISLIWVACFLPASMICTYLFVEFIWPLLSKKRNFFTIFFAVCIAALVLISVSCVLNRVALLKYNGTAQNANFQESLQLTYFHSIVFTILLTSLVTAVMVIKSWYLQVEENTSLYQQKVYNELNLLKSQIYPDFLSNSLATLRNQLDVSSTKAAKLLLNLSDILSYLLYDSRNEQVPLKKEIMIIKNFVEVVKHGRMNTIEFADEIAEEADARFIPPLILFSLMQTVLPGANNLSGENPFVQVAVSSEKNDLIQVKIICRFKKSRITDQYKQNEIKKIEERLAIFPLLDKNLTVVNNENQIDYSILIKTTGIYNFSSNGTELNN